MKLITEHGQLPLPDDLEISVEQHNPFFSDEGASSVPVTIPATLQALSVLGRPERVGATGRLRRIRATLSEGVFIRNGQLLMESASADEGITCSFLLAESEFYTQFKEKTLRDIFADKVRQEWTDIGALYAYLAKLYRGEATDDFILCPVAVDYDSDAGTYKANNAPLAGGQLEYLSRYIPDGEDSILVPDGYGIAPFLYLHRLIDLMFSLSGYTVANNPFRTDAALKQIIVLHNVSDVICTGKIDYSDLVPDMTVSDFLEWLRDKFLATASIYPDRKQVDVYLLQDVLSNAVADMDLSGKIDGPISISFNDTSRVVLRGDTSLDGAAPAADTIEDFASHNKIVTDVTEEKFNSSTISRYYVVHRVATGEYFSFAENTQKNTSTIKQTRLGTDYFNYDRQLDSETEVFSPSDLLPAMVFVEGILMPYIGSRSHRHTQINNKEESPDSQKMIIAYDRGVFDPNASYRMATVLRYDATGNTWTDYSLTPEGLYNRFFSLYNGILRGGKEIVSGHLVLTLREIIDLDIVRKKLYRGQYLLIDTLSYSFKMNKIDFGTSSFLLLKNTSNPDVAPSFENQQYYWKANVSAINTRLEELEDLYGGPNAGGSASFYYPEGAVFPAEPPASAGLKAYYQNVPVHFTITDDMTGEIVREVDEDATIWYDSLEIQ